MKNGNQNHPEKGSRIAVVPIRRLKDIKAVSGLTKSNPRNHLLYTIGINNGIRACDIVKLKVTQARDLKVGDTLTAKISDLGIEV